jgi:hypothetical protein
VDEWEDITDIALMDSVYKFLASDKTDILIQGGNVPNKSQQITWKLITVPAYEVLTEVNANIMVFRDMTSYSIGYVPVFRRNMLLPSLR